MKLIKHVDKSKPDDDAFMELIVVSQSLFRKPFQVLWDATMFRVYNDQFPLYIKNNDLVEITHDN